MNLRQIEYILAVAETKSFGKAAEKVFITQSTISTLVARFEDEIGIKIFDRKTKPISTTKEGLSIIKQLKLISKQFDNLDEVVHELKGEVKGQVKIGVIQTVAPYLLPLFLDEMTMAYPKVRFEVSEISTAQIIRKTLSRELDIGILSIPIDLPDLKCTHLYNEPFYLYDKGESNSKKKLDIDDIDLNRLWLLEEGHCMRTQIETICTLHKKQHIHGNLDYKSGTIHTLLKFVDKNNGVTLLPHLAVQELSDKNKTYLSMLNEPIPARSIGLIVHKHFVKNKILNWLETFIKEKTKPLLGKQELKHEIIAPL